VYLFHEIVEDISHVKNEFAISEISFLKFLEQLLAAGREPLDIKESGEYLNRRTKNAYNRFIITFDDVYESFHKRAYPILKKLHIPFTLFITVDLLDKPGYLSRGQLLILAADPLCTVGSHSMHHVIFRKLNKTEVERELHESKEQLEQLLEQPVETFAFPYGTVVTVSAKNVKQLRESAYKFAFSAIQGSLAQKWFTSKYFLPRINVDEALAAGTIRR
jgi:peptidoglycan/xylan/chitin deacetylase (PgdA/CDA1 family)